MISGRVTVARFGTNRITVVVRKKPKHVRLLLWSPLFLILPRSLNIFKIMTPFTDCGVEFASELLVIEILPSSRSSLIFSEEVLPKMLRKKDIISYD